MSTYANGLLALRKRDGQQPLRRWLWLSYLRTAIMPLLFIEVTFLVVYLISNSIVHRQNISAIRSTSTIYLNDIATREAENIGSTLQSISLTTAFYARQSSRALEQANASPPADAARYRRGAGGALFTAYDNGGTASFYSGVMPIGPAELNKVWRLAALDPAMIDIQKGNPLIASIYINTFDSYNRIYPYIDAQKQYPFHMDITKYNFYYEADGMHDPARRAVWTDAYEDPAGHGWMVSSIAPVWGQSRLEAVVGIDVTLDTIITRLKSTKLPWGGYALLVDRQGGIIAMPPQGEVDFDLREMVNHRHPTAIEADILKPEHFNIARRADTRALGQALLRQPHGQVPISLHGKKQIASFAHIDGPDWTLVVIAPEAQIFAKADQLRDRLQLVGFSMLGVLLIFYAAFFAYLYRRAQSMAQQVAEPVSQLAARLRRIGSGEYRQSFAGSPINELDELGSLLVDTGNRLGDANDLIVEQEAKVAQALVLQQQLNEEQSRMVEVVSHELRTPLAIVGSSAQILDRKADGISPDDLRKRAAKIGSAVKRMADILQKLTDSQNGEFTFDIATEASEPRLADIMFAVARGSIAPDRLVLSSCESNPQLRDAPTISIVLRTLLDNALRYSPAGSPIKVACEIAGARGEIRVSNEGPGIPAAELNRIGERFFRGSNATRTEGAGVGLYVARKLMERIQGELTVESTGEGTVCTLAFDVVVLDNDPSPSAEQFTL